MKSVPSTPFLKINLTPWVLTFIFIYMALWTLAPTWVRSGLPMDALEGTTWGHQLEWGYDKNPFMNAWLTALAVKLGNYSDWVIYAFSQLSVGICFWCVWLLGKKIVGPEYAFLSVLLLGTAQYYNLHAIDFNDNTLELSLWGLTILYFYQAITRGKNVDWIFLGFFAGLSFMTKYFFVVLAVPLFLFMLLYSPNRSQFKQKGFYIACVIFIVVSLPHFIWLFNHDFITLDYAFNRVSAPPTLLNHIFYPFHFLLEQVEVLIPACICLIIFFKKNYKEKHSQPIPSFDKAFLTFVAWGPLLTTALLSAVFGMKLRGGWGQPLLSFVPLWFFSITQPCITVNRLKVFFTLLIFILVGTIVGYCVALYIGSSPSSAIFPGKQIAKEVEKKWHDQFHVPIQYVVGPRGIAGNVAYYGKDRPVVFIEADKKLSPWVNEQDLLKKGAVFISESTEKGLKEETLRKRFPKLGYAEVKNYKWVRNKSLKPIQVQLAILPPSGE